MDSDALLDELMGLLAEELEGIERVGNGLRVARDLRYGDVTLRIDHDADAAGLRVHVEVPPPVLGGAPFLRWCLHTNTEYWDVKFGIDDRGMLLAHADLEEEEGEDREELAQRIVDRADTITALLDEDLVDYLLSENLGTDPQQDRWRARTPVSQELGDDEEDGQDTLDEGDDDGGDE
jgi:hypothetical protein